MGRKCNVLDCPSDSRRLEDNGVTFHKMPFHSDLRPKWIELCRIPEERQMNKVIYVCSRHFRRTDFCNFKGTKYMLRQGALPSVFPWTKSVIKIPPPSKPTTPSSKSTTSSSKSTTPSTKSTLPSSKCIPPSSKSTLSSEDFKVPENVEIKEECLDDNNKKDDEIVVKIKDEPMDEDIKEEEEPKIKKEIEYEKPPKVKKENKKEIPPEIVPALKIKDEFPIVINFFAGTRIEANDFNDKWYPATILEVDYEENEVFVEFDRHLNRANEWIPMDSSRLRPYVQNTTAEFAVGEKCMATWVNSCSKYPATIKQVLEGDSYEVLFDDGFTKILKQCKLSKIKDPNNIPQPPKPPVPHAAPLFDPVVGSKAERRERKRKINVAQLFGPKKKRYEDEEDEEFSAMVGDPFTPLYIAEGEEWTCRWLNGEPVGVESTLESPDGTRRSIIVADHRLPTGWEKHLTQRMYGSSAGKWDAILVNPDGKKFANRQQLKLWMEDNKVDCNIEKFDFSLHIGRAKKLGLYEVTDPSILAAVIKPTPLPRPIGHKKGSKRDQSKASTPKTSVVAPPVTSDVALPEPEVEEEEDNAGSLKIIHENNSYKCPIEGCGKNFRRENLAQMHIKHYHPEYSKLIGSTPNVADLAYARTVGENIDEIIPPKIKTIASPSLEKDRTTKMEHTPKQKSTIKVLTPKVPDYSVLPSNSCMTPKPVSKDSEIIKLLNSEPKTKMDSIFDSVETIKQLTSEEIMSDRHSEIKLKDLLTKSEPIPIKKEDTPARGPGIKILLPTIRNVPEEGRDLETEPEKIMRLDRGKTGRKRPSMESVKRRQSFKYDTDEMSDYFEGDSRSQDSFKLKNIEPPINTPPYQEGKVIIEGGEVIRLVHMRSEEIINCTCGVTEEDGLMIQCELCLCWQHAYCNNIAKENEVPEKYVCKICKNPPRMRPSKQYFHDQDWLKLGTLPTANFHSRNEELLGKRFETLRKSHELSGCVGELNDYLHNLRVKLNIAENKDHPKLYLWSKPWDKPILNTKLNLTKPDDIKQETKEENMNSSFSSSDHSYIKSTTFGDLSLKSIIQPPQIHDDKNEIKDEKIESQYELLSILQGDTPVSDMKNPSEVNDTYPKIDLNSMITNNLAGKIDLKEQPLENKEEALNSITSGILSSSSLELALSQSDLDRLSSLAQFTELVPTSSGPMQSLIPQPEDVIDPADCRLNLLDHVAHFQSLVEERLNAIENELTVLEESDSNPIPEGEESDSKMKQTMQMLIRDLGTMRQIAALNN